MAKIDRLIKTRLVSLIIAAAAVMLIAGGCGSDKNGSSEESRQVVENKTVDKSEEADAVNEAEKSEETDASEEDSSENTDATDEADASDSEEIVGSYIAVKDEQDSVQQEGTFTRGSLSDLGSIDVEAEVKVIRSIYNDIVKAQNDGLLAEENFGGATAYRNQNDEIVILIIPKGTDGIAYRRQYYFDERKLIFAYIEAGDSQRLYFKNGIMFRWRHCADANDNTQYEDHDLEYSEAFSGWEDFAYLDLENVEKR